VAAKSIRVTVKARGHQRERRFPAGTSLRVIQDWKDRERGRLKDSLPPASPGTFAKDVERYLETLVDRPTLRQERAHQLDWWIARFGRLRRDQITAPAIRAHLAELRTHKAASTCNHYKIALSHLWTTLDGKNARNPCRDVPLYDEPEAEPRNLPAELVTLVLGTLHPLGRAVKGQKRSHVNLTLIRLRIMATTGLSPAEIRRVTADDLLLEQRAVYVRRRLKGKGSPGMVLPLTEAGVAAFQALADADAFGYFSTESVHQMWKRACKRLLKRDDLSPATRRLLQTSRPYDLRHTFGTFLLHQTQDLNTTRELMRHRTSKTTLRYVRSAVAPHLRAAIDGIRQPDTP
jgi:integrase